MLCREEVGIVVYPALRDLCIGATRYCDPSHFLTHEVFDIFPLRNASLAGYKFRRLLAEAALLEILRMIVAD